MGIRLKVKSLWSRDESTCAEYGFSQGRVVIGRRTSCDVRLPHSSVSSVHATLREEGAGYVVVDEGSINGTYVNQTRLVPQRSKRLRQGDVLRIGTFLLELHVEPIAQDCGVEETRSLALRLLRGESPDASKPLPAPELRILNGPRSGDSILLSASPMSVRLGRGEDCDLALPDADCSREHCEILRDAAGVRVRDLGSKNGIFVNSKKCEEKWLFDRDEIRVGQTVIAFEDAAAEMLEEITNGEEEALSEPLSAKIQAALATPSPEMTAEEPVESPEEDRDAPSLGNAATIDATAEPAVEVKLSAETPRQGGERVDLFVYVLAGAILALSAAGLWWVFAG